MSLLASLALTSLAAFAPQGDTTAPAAGGRPPLLTPAEQASLRDKIVKYLDADEAYALAEGIKDREKTGKKREGEKEKLQKEWDLRSKKGDLLSSMADLRAIYDNCFVVPAPKFTPGTLRKEKPKDSGLESALWLPKTYKVDKPMRAILALPGTATAEANSAWVEGDRYFEALFEKSPLLADTIIHVSYLPNSPSPIEMDPVPDFSREGQDVQENRRIEVVFRTFGASLNAVNVNRARIFLDCARGNCAFGLRFASMFPDRFAGIVLRHPTEVDGIRFGSLSGMPVLILKTAATAAATDALKAKLEAVTPNSVTVLDTTDEYPHKAAAADISTWMDKQRRSMVPAHVVIEPNHDRFKKAYWVAMGPMNPLHTASEADKGRVEVDADRANNRIVVKARGVESFTLFLNDDLVDLDKEFTVVVNDKAITEKRTRDLRGLEKRMVERRDCDFLFPVQFDCAVPKAAPATGDKQGEKAGTTGAK